MKSRSSSENEVKPLVDYTPSFLHRGNLREVVIVLACLSALFQPIDLAGILISFFLLALGSFIHFISKGILIRSELTKSGIYALVRHPYYMASYLIDLSFCLLSSNVYLLVAYPFLFFWTYGYTLRKEDELLSKLHPDTFFPYLTEVPSVFPDALSIKGSRQIFGGFSIRRVSKKEVARLLRYWGTALLIVFLHGIIRKGPGGFTFQFDLNRWETRTILGLMVILYLANFLLLWSSKKFGRQF